MADPIWKARAEKSNALWRALSHLIRERRYNFKSVKGVRDALEGYMENLLYLEGHR